MVDESDWRIETKGEEAFRGLAFRFARWEPSEGRIWDPQTGEATPLLWDHDHCHFCTAKLAAPDDRDPDRLQAGYLADDPRPDGTITPLDVAERFGGAVRVQEPVDDTGLWVCPQCFEELGPYYGWTVEDGPTR